MKAGGLLFFPRRIARGPGFLRKTTPRLLIISGKNSKKQRNPNGPTENPHRVAVIVTLRIVPPRAERPGPAGLIISLLPEIAKVPASL
jgi:hypothetical protein